MESGSGIGGMMPLHVEWISDDTVSISHTYTQNGDLMYDPEMTFLIDRDKGTMEAASFQQDSLGIYQNVYPEPGRWVPELRKDLNNFAQQWLKNISEQNYVKREAIVVENGEDVTLEFDSEGTLIQPKQLSDEPRDPLAPAYKVGDTVYLDDKEFTITEIGLHDVQLQDPTLLYPVFRLENKENFERLLRRDERNRYIADFLSANLEWSNGDLCEVLTSEYGFFSQEEKDEISFWIRSGETNSQIREKMREQFSYRSDSMELSDVRADHDSSGDGLTIFLVDSAPNEDEEYPKEIISASWDEITELVRAMYQQELGGFHHDLPLQKPPAVEVPPAPVQPEMDAQPNTAPSESTKFSTKTVAIYPAEKNNLPFDVVIETLHVDEPQRGPAPQNFHITDDNLGAGGAKAKYQMNIAALRTLQKIESENRTATPEEQAVLSKYVGWGALADAFDEDKPSWAAEYKELRETLTPEEYESARASTLNAHYTSPTVIKAIYQALENMGFKDGNILEPSCGVGNFFGLLPDSMSGSKLYGVELDGLTGRIAKRLYPNARIEIKGYENTNFQNNSFDLAIGNVPFGQYKVFDPAYNKLGFSIHNYFFAKAIDQVRPGGIVAFVTSRYTMDSKATEAREYMAQRAELLGAIRLPNNAFLSNAGTEVVSDILFLQKREQPITELPDWVQTGENKDGYTINSYFGRDYLTVGNYISKVFPFLGVRFIAVNDGIDSIRPSDIDSLDTSFKALLYDLYSRDLSRKTRSARRFRAQKGEYFGARPLYGYVKDPERKNHLIIDPPAAEIVRRIFSMVGDGMSIAQTANVLNHQQIPTPMQYKTAAGTFVNWHCISKKNFWTEAAVLRVVRDVQYTGSTVYGKRYYDIVGQSHSVKVSKKDWIIVPDVHEPIVSREEYDRAQAALKKYEERDVTAGTKTKIRCGGCGHAMERKKAKEPYYICRTPGVTDRFPCPKERISEQEIHAALLDSLRAMAQIAVNMDKLLREQQKEQMQDVAAMRRSFSALQEQLFQLKRQMKSQYEAFVMGEIGKEAYLAVKAMARQKEEILTEQISKLELSMEQVQLADRNEDGLAAQLQPYLNIEQLTEGILDDLLAQVLVFPGGRLEIQWKFRDELERLRKMALR